VLQLLRSSWSDRFDGLLGSASSSLVLCSPYIGCGPCRKIEERASSWPRGFSLLVLTDLSRDNMLSGSTDVVALTSIVDAFPATEVRFLPSLHAKVYVADEKEAVVTSANMTDNGLARNLEYGVHLTDPDVVHRVRRDVLDFASLGSTISVAQLKAFVGIVLELRDLHRAADRSIKARLRREFARKLEQANIEIVRARAGGRAPHAIFADAIRYFLRAGPATTESLNRAIQQIHPDLCDDRVDRIIDGRHFGKKWKHAVRTAQQYLKRLGEIELAGGRWQLVA